MEKAIDFIKRSIIKPFEKKIRVFGWQKEYDYNLISSVSKYLFEDFDVIENIAPLENDNRDGRVKEKFYVTVHDTGDSDPLHNASFWSNVVKNQYWENGKYSASYQYVVGNDGIYHNIPDNEVAYHAGDTTQFDYCLYDSSVSGDKLDVEIDISDDGFYMIDGKKTSILAPRAYKEKDGVVLLDRIANKNDFNSQGILCKNIDSKYYIGETYFNTTYELISNRGGNNNSIGIESCINEGSDIYYTWQKTAKLVANLLYNNDLAFDDVKQHHYFSGKNCPQTIRMSDMWNHFMDLVKCEYEAILLMKEGYCFKLLQNRNCLENGRLNKMSDDIKFSIEISKGGEKTRLDF